MDFWIICFLLWQRVLQYPKSLGDALGEESGGVMEARAKQLELERVRLEREVKPLSWEHLVLELGQLLQYFATALLLSLVLHLCFPWWRNFLRREEYEEGVNGANEEEVRNVEAAGEDVGNEEQDANLEEDNDAHGNVQGVGDVAANEEDDVGNEVVNEAANAENSTDVANVVQEVDRDWDEHIGRVLMERIQWPVQDLQAGCEWTRVLMHNYAIFFEHLLPNTFYPVLHRAIGVGSAFEGWSPHEQDVGYCVLIPMTAPRGHSFHLELVTAGQRHQRNFRVRVQQECTCTSEQQQEGENMLCFLHHPEEELRRNQNPSLLDTLCTSSYLDVRKTARWLCQLVSAIWPSLPLSLNWDLVLLPSRHSCRFMVTNGQESFQIEMLFGVQRGDSDIFVSSQPREFYTQSTIWPENYDVAEMKFFKHIARQAPRDSVHLKCLQFFACLQVGIGFSTYATKTIVMHLLNVIPPSQWRRRHFLGRLEDIFESLCLCVHETHLSHFIVGNQRLPQHISVPPDVQTAGRYNIFQHLEQQSDAYIQAITEYMLLRKWFDIILLSDN